MCPFILGVYTRFVSEETVDTSILHREVQVCTEIDSTDLMICCERHIRNNQFNNVGRPNYGGSGIMVWEDIYHGGHTDLNVINGGILTGMRYRFGLAFHQNDYQARHRFVEWAQNEIAVVPDFHKRISLSDEAHFWLNGYVNKQNCRIWSEATPQVYVETPLHPEKLTVWCSLWAGGILLQK
ncbi:hypothetical protein TNCV_808041 [Trichonephila clavipes]|nr:hypothetical protein TNCV_808041 [Trichonephila clavipes]